jgi:DNA polymerase III epsilon subunit-like protein
VADGVEAGFAALELRERAFRFIEQHHRVSEEAVLAHVYGGALPSGLRGKLAAPLLADARLERDADGLWSVRLASKNLGSATTFTALVVVPSGPNPTRARLVRLVAFHVQDEHVVAHFDATLNPGRRVPRYVADRVGVEVETLNGLPSFADVLNELERFLSERPILAQDADLAWAFIDAEARGCKRVLVQPRLLDVNDLASALLELEGKPSLGRVASHLGISSTDIAAPDEEARVLVRVGCRLLAMAPSEATRRRDAAVALRRGATARALPDEPGVYVMRDRDQQPLYVGKARRLRSRLAAYVHRPLGATRRLEGLVSHVEVVDSTLCATDLEALILEDREIRRLEPRFNTVRQQRLPRIWIRRPASGLSARGRPLAPPRLELSGGPGSAAGEFVGPFRNEMLADQARQLAREVFELDALRHAEVDVYAEQLAQAWRFLGGDSQTAEALARQRSVTLLRKVVAFDVQAMLLPADPRQANYAVVRPAPGGAEVFVLRGAVLYGWGVVLSVDDDVRPLLDRREPRTYPEDIPVVLRWFGAQRPPTRLVWLPEDDADAIEAAVVSLG